MSNAATTPQGYPDDGRVAAYYGGAILNQGGVTLPGGTTVDLGTQYVGAFSALQLFLQGGQTDDVLYQIFFRGAAADVDFIREIDYTVKSHGTFLFPVRDTIPILGPYVNIKVKDLGFTTQNLGTMKVFPSQQLSDPGGERNGLDTTIGAGTSPFVFMPNVRRGPAVLTWGTLPANFFAYVQYYDQTTGALTDLMNLGSSGSITPAGAALLSLPPSKILIGATNNTAAGVGFQFQLVTLPKS